jgi:lysozyme
MKTPKSAIELIKSFEGIRLEAYLCPANVPTIGYGSTTYQNGSKVKLGDSMSPIEAEELLIHEINKFETYVKRILKSKVTENQFGALVSFCFNLGPKNLENSSLLRKVNANPNDATIRDEFMKWVNAGGKKLAGLERRRKAEADLYFL